MKNTISKYLKLNRIEFIVTWQCGGMCAHCSIGSDINRRGANRHVLPEYAADAVRKLSRVFDITSVMTFGGEPLYYPEVTAAIHKAATGCGVATRQIITKGYFTNGAERSKSVADMLAEAGVNNLLLSVDAFHQKNIPFEPVRRFAQDVVDAKIPGFRLHPAWLVNEEHKNPYNDETKNVLGKFSDFNIPVSKGNNVSPGGNAIKFLNEFFSDVKPDLTEGCGTAPYSDPLTKITSISIEPDGGVKVCDFTIGNIYTEDIIDIVERYDPYENEAMRSLIEGGVAGLLAYAETKGVSVDASEYRSACNACKEIVKRLASLN